MAEIDEREAQREEYKKTVSQRQKKARNRLIVRYVVSLVTLAVAIVITLYTCRATAALEESREAETTVSASETTIATQ